MSFICNTLCLSTKSHSFSLNSLVEQVKFLQSADRCTSDLVRERTVKKSLSRASEIDLFNEHRQGRCSLIVIINDQGDEQLSGLKRRRKWGVYKSAKFFKCVGTILMHSIRHNQIGRYSIWEKIESDTSLNRTLFWSTFAEAVC